MAWAGGVWDTTYGTSTGSINVGQQTYYDKKFLKRVSENLFMWQFGQKRPIPQGEGKTILFSRYHEISSVTTPLTEGTNPDATAITGAEVNRTLEEWGGFSQHSSLVSRTNLDRGLAQVAGLWGDQAGRSVDLRTAKEVVANGCHTIRADNANTGGLASGVKGPITVGSTTSCTTTVTYSDTAALTDDLMIGGLLTFTSGKNYGQSRYISDNASAAAESSVTVTLPFENAAAAGDTFYVSHPGWSNATTMAADAMDTTDVITHKTLTKAWERLKTEKAAPYSGGFYTLILGPTTHAGFMSDGTWIGLQQYMGGDSKLYNGEIGKYMGFRVVTTTQPFRCTLATTATTGGPGQTDTNYYTAGANYSATGTGHYSLAFGREAFGVTMFPGWNKPKIIVKNPGPSDTSNPLNRFSTVGWELPFVPCALNALWCVAIVSGA